MEGRSDEMFANWRNSSLKGVDNSFVGKSARLVETWQYLEATADGIVTLKAAKKNF